MIPSVSVIKITIQIILRKLKVLIMKNVDFLKEFNLRHILSKKVGIAVFEKYSFLLQDICEIM